MILDDLRGPAGMDVMAWAMYFMRHIYPASHVRLHCCVWNGFINPGDISSDLSCFRSPPPWASWASEQLLRPQPDQGHGHCGHQCGGHWLPDVPRAPVHTPGHPGGKVTWLYIIYLPVRSWHCSFDLHEITTGLLSVLTILEFVQHLRRCKAIKCNPGDHCIPWSWFCWLAKCMHLMPIIFCNIRCYKNKSNKGPVNWFLIDRIVMCLQARPRHPPSTH